jgi:hypothetical protein
MNSVLSDRLIQRFSLAYKVLLTNKLIQRIRADTICERAGV